MTETTEKVPNEEPCTYCVKDQNLKPYRPLTDNQIIFLLLIPGAFVIPFVWILPTVDSPLTREVVSIALVLPALFAVFNSWRFIMRNLFSYQLFFAKDEQGKRHVHRKGPHAAWMAEKPGRAVAMFRLRFGGIWWWTHKPLGSVLVATKDPTISRVEHGTYPDWVVLQCTAERYELHVPWQAALDLLEKPLGIEKMRMDRDQFLAMSDVFAIGMYNIIDWITESKHTVARSEHGKTTKLKLIDLLSPYEEQFGQRWADLRESEQLFVSRGDLDPERKRTEPDHGPREVFPDDHSGYNLEGDGNSKTSPLGKGAK